MQYIRFSLAIVICAIFVCGAERPAHLDSAKIDTALSSAKEYVARGDAYREKDDNDSAIAEYNEAIRLNPNDAEAYCNRGIAYVNKGCYRSAAVNYAKAIWLDPIKYCFLLSLVFLPIWAIWFLYSIVNAVIKFKKERNKMQYLLGIVKNMPLYVFGVVIGIVIGIAVVSAIVQITDYHDYSVLVALGALIGAVVICGPVHELGHFLAAKCCKMRVDVFAVGLDKTLLKWKHSGTEYRVNAVPFWGYVKMAGNEYVSKPIWQRAVVALAGPTANVIVAFLAFWTLCLCGLDRPLYLDSALRIGSIEWNSPADSAGFLVGDSIVSINGSPVATWDQMWNQIDTILCKQKRNDYKIVVLRDGKPVEFEIHVKRTGKRLSDVPTDGLSPASVPAIVGKVEPKSGADGVLKVGDTILAFKGVPVSHIEEVYDLMYSRYNPRGDSKAVAFDIKRGEELMRLAVVPKYVSTDGYSYYSLGIESVPEPTRLEHYGTIGALRQALCKVWGCPTLLCIMKSKEVRKSAPSMIGDPTGWELRDILYIIGVVGINIAMVSLVIDGLLLIYLLIEAVRGKPLSKEKERNTIW